jgi:TRAP-type uncharacterized transport system substrate-binding protein
VRPGETEDDLVYAITSRILEKVDRLADVHPSLAAFNPYTAWRNVPTPVHPGAARAYRDCGYLD